MDTEKQDWGSEEGFGLVAFTKSKGELCACRGNAQGTRGRFTRWVMHERFGRTYKCLVAFLAIVLLTWSLSSTDSATMVSLKAQNWATASIISMLGGAALFVGVNSQSNPPFISDDTFFYGQSPPVYPSPEAQGHGTWKTAHANAVKFVGQMTPQERASLTVGWPATTGCSGEIPPIPRLKWPGMCLVDAGNGVRNTDFVNGWPSGIHVGAAWNRNLTYQRGLYMGKEFRAKGVNIMLGPVVGPLGRVAQAGRNWEGFSNDPYLCGQLAAESIKGSQKAGVITSIKHLLGNEQELYRNPPSSTGIASVSSNIDDKTMHELYLWPFQDAVKAGSGSVMCSYNRLNNSYACQNSHLLNGLLKTELGFEGFVVTDWGGQHSGLASANAGLDMVMPDSNGFWEASGVNLITSVNNGSLADSRLTDMAVRIVAAWYQLGQDQNYPALGVGMPKDYLDGFTPHAIVEARDPASPAVVLQGAIEGHVLVKNVQKALPLKKPKFLSVFGYDAVAPPKSNVGADGRGFDQYSVGYEPVYDYGGFFTNDIPPQIARNGTLTTGGGSGANANAYISAPLDAIQQQAYEDNTVVYWDTIHDNPNVNPVTEACLVFINAFSSEQNDRLGLRDDYSDGLVNNVANKCGNTIVVIHNAGIRIVDKWIDHPNVKAVILAHLPGQDSGRALVQLLYGKASPSGKMPYTLAKTESDYNVLNGDGALGEYQLFPQSNFSEGVYIDYRDFDKKNITPRYEFGFGLTYTTFEFSDLTAAKVKGANTSYLPANETIIEGGLPSLWDIIATVTAVVHNTGDTDAKEVAQLYVGIPGGPVRQLRGFEKVFISSGGDAKVEFDLTRRDLSEWSVEEQNWVLQRGDYRIYVGSSSRDLPLTGTLTI